MTSDGRRDQRQAISLKIRFKSATLSDFVEQNSKDLSRGGMFVKMSSPMPVGTLIKFDLRLDDEQSLIQGVGRVVWRREESNDGAPAGMGIKFIKLDDTSRANLDAVIRSKVEGGGGEMSLPPSVVPMVGPPSKPPKPISPIRAQADKKKTKLGTPVLSPPGSGAPMPGAEAGEGEAGKKQGEKEPETVDIDKVPAREEPEDGDYHRSTSPQALDDMPSNSEWDEDSDPHEMATVVASIPDIQELLGHDSKDKAPGREDDTAKVELENTGANAASSRPPEDSAEAQREREEKEPSQDEQDEPAGEEEPATESGLLADISVAIDSALHEKESKGEKTGAQPVSAPDGEKEGLPVEQEARVEVNFEKLEKQQESQDEEPAEEFGRGLADRAEPSGGRFGAGIAILVLLGLAGAAVWYFLFGPGRPVDTVGDDVPEAEVLTARPGEDAAVLEGVKQDAQAETGEQEPGTKHSTTAVQVHTEPAEAKIFLDGELQEGDVPLTLNIEPGRSVEIRASAWGYASETRELEVSEEQVDVRLELEKAPVHAVFKVQPKGAAIFVDGTKWGRTPNTVKKKGIPKEFAYKIVKSGYEDFVGKVGSGDWAEDDGVYSVTVEGELDRSPRRAPVRRRPSRTSSSRAEKEPKKEDETEKKTETENTPEPKKPDPPEKAPEKQPPAAEEKAPQGKKVKPQAVDENPF